MQLALISDIHANLPAFEAVLKKIDELKPDLILCLGDVVGYGPKPAECIDILIDRKIQNVMGNHDAAVVGKQDLGLFRDPNQSLLKWTMEHLSVEQLAFLNDSPYTIKSEELNFLAVHASPIEPKRWHYIQSAIDGRKILEDFPQDVCFVGHTHVPAIIADKLGVFNVKAGSKFIVNPGSVGQARDHDKRASFGIFNFDDFSYKNYRVEFNKSHVFQQLEEIGIKRDDIRRLMPL